MKQIRYDGPHNGFDAVNVPGGRAGLVFRRGGQALKVSNELAEQLLTQPHHQFTEVEGPAEPVPPTPARPIAPAASNQEGD